MANLLEHYEGALVGALVGDCLGAPFEWILGNDYKKTMKKIMTFITSVDNGKKKGKLEYTDDTAMLRCVANSLVEHKKLNTRDLAKRFTEEYFSEPNRGYGGNIHQVFELLHDTRFSDPFGPAEKQFEGKGSFGNGGAMRIAPAALFGFHYSEIDFNSLVTEISRVTHSNRDAINGAILECSAVQIALKSNLSDKPLTAEQMLEELLEKMNRVEGLALVDTQFQGGAPLAERPYCAKLTKIKQILQQPFPPDVHTVANELGNNVSAIDSVPSAVYSFLDNIEPRESWEDEEFNPFQRTIIYAISLGGDTDTIASMAGAIAGAYYGIKSIPMAWQQACEKLDEAIEQAGQLYQLAEDNKKPSSSCIIA